MSICLRKVQEHNSAAKDVAKELIASLFAELQKEVKIETLL
jgi:hypothetical protein